MLTPITGKEIIELAVQLMLPTMNLVELHVAFVPGLSTVTATYYIEKEQLKQTFELLSKMQVEGTPCSE